MLLTDQIILQETKVNKKICEEVQDVYLFIVKLSALRHSEYASYSSLELCKRLLPIDPQKLSIIIQSIYKQSTSFHYTVHNYVLLIKLDNYETD